VAWAPQLDWDAKATLKDFDPGYFVPGWNGRLSGNLASKAASCRRRPMRAGHRRHAGSHGGSAVAEGMLRQRNLDAGQVRAAGRRARVT
jgi:translocation and assembly module TamB